MTRITLVVISLALVAGATLYGGGKPEDSGEGIHVNGDRVALNGADVVAYHGLPSEAGAVYGRKTYS